MIESIFSTGHVVGGRYKLEGFLAAGGMQEVYIASDRLLPRKVALKTPKNGSAVKRFKSSAELSARINHPFVAKTYDYFEIDDRAFLIEEFVDGGNLESFRTESLSQFDPHLLAQFGHQFAKALAASHHVGVVHRDLKPNNIIVERVDGQFNFKVTDFGIAKLTEEELDRAHKSEGTITGSSTMFGALPYMSPELIDDPKSAGKGSDVWAFGAILYTLMAGKYPFGFGLKAIPGIMSGSVPEIPAFCTQLIQYKDLSGEILKLILSCLVIETEKRPTAEQLATRFSELCYGSYPRSEGVIARYKHAEVGAYGFISTGGPDVFFHRDSFYGTEVSTGQRVMYSSHPGTPQDRAHPVVPMVQSSSSS